MVDATVAQAAEARVGPVVIFGSDSRDVRHLATLIGFDSRVIHL